MTRLLLRMLTWWRMPTLGTALFTWRKGELVGADAQENRYYREKNGEKRWVYYASDIEASLVPPEWNAWLHGTVAEPPAEVSPALKPWEKEHQPNRTGTPEAYHPPGSLTGAARRHKSTGDYEAWQPDG